MSFINIKGEKVSAVISTVGAELFSLKSSDGLEYLWQGDVKYWGDRSPTLFPYIGRLTEGKYIYNDKEYFLPIHGFAPASEFTVTETSDTHTTMVLRSSNKTLEVYPFEFEFSITYKICGDTLTVDCSVKNLSAETMYFGYGGHPGFNVPLEMNLDFEDYYLQLDGAQAPRRIRFSENKFVEDGTDSFALDNAKRLNLVHNLFDNDAIVLVDAGNKVTLGTDKGSHGVEVVFPDMKYIGFWHANETDAPYVCIEPWSSLPANEGSVTILNEQDNLISLNSGETYNNCWSVKLF